MTYEMTPAAVAEGSFFTDFAELDVDYAKHLVIWWKIMYKQKQIPKSRRKSK